MEQNFSADDTRLLKRWWVRIVGDSKYMKMCQENTKVEGPGINIFKFLPSGDRNNCEYYYYEKDSSLWELIVARNPDLFKEYVSSKHFLVCVAVPTRGVSDVYETLQKVGLFEYDTFKNVD